MAIHDLSFGRPVCGTAIRLINGMPVMRLGPIPCRSLRQRHGNQGKGSGQACDFFDGIQSRHSGKKLLSS
jgi:hypothetical protein